MCVGDVSHDILATLEVRRAEYEGASWDSGDSVMATK